MSITFADPPPLTWIRTDSDEAGEPRLTWVRPRSLRGRVIVGAVSLGVAAALGYLAYRVGVPMAVTYREVFTGGQPDWGGLGWYAHIMGLVFFTAAFAVPTVVACWMVYSAFHVRGPDRLTFGKDALRYEREDPLGLRRLTTVIPRAEMGKVRLEWVEASPPRRRFGQLPLTSRRQQLTIDLGAEPVEIGRDLRDVDREWLSDLLEDWAAEGERPARDLLDLPPNSPVTAERDADGRLTLRWPPTRPEMVRHRQEMVGNLVGPLIVGPVMGFLAYMAVYLAVLAIREGNPWGFAVVGFLLIGPVMVGRHVAAELPAYWYTLRGPRWARLILGPEGLRYQPGRHVVKKKLCAERPHVVPRPELGEIRLEPLEGRRRLTVDHGAERIEIGAELRDPEREWLAAVLRNWAGRPASTPRPTAPGSWRGRRAW